MVQIRPAWSVSAATPRPQNCPHHIQQEHSSTWCGSLAGTPQGVAFAPSQPEVPDHPCVVCCVKPLWFYLPQQIRLPLLKQGRFQSSGEDRRMLLPLEHFADRPEMVFRRSENVVVEDVPSVHDRQFSNHAMCAARNRAEPTFLHTAARREDIAVSEIHSRREITHAVIKCRAAYFNWHADDLPRIVKIFCTWNVPCEGCRDVHRFNFSLDTICDILDCRAPKNASVSVGDAAVFLGNTRAIRFISAAPFFSISLHSVTASSHPQCRRRGSAQLLSPDIPPVSLPRIPDKAHTWCGIPLSVSGSPSHMAASSVITTLM